MKNLSHKMMQKVFFALLLAISLRASAGSSASPSAVWLGTWAASPQPHQRPPTIANQTLRQIVHVSVGGETLRVHLSNLYGHLPLVIESASIATDTSFEAAHLLTVSGKVQIVIAPGSEVVTDALALHVDPLQNVAINLYVSQTTELSTFHSMAAQTSFISQPGNYTNQAQMPVQQTIRSWYIITGVDVAANAGSHGLVALGDSITDGIGSSLNNNKRWPDALARRISKANQTLGVMNQGVGFNRILNFQPDLNQPSESALARFERDVLSRPGVTHVVILEGINDISLEPKSVAAADIAQRLIDAYKTMILKAHAKGLKIYGATLTPIAGASCDSPEHRVSRHLVNDWIRTPGHFDKILDFDQAIRDPNNPERMRPAFDSGDHLHPSDLGYETIAASIDLNLF